MVKRLAKPKLVPHPQCDFCKRYLPLSVGVKTRYETILCELCAYALKHCEICGSLNSDHHLGEQLHYDDDCFK